MSVSRLSAHGVEELELSDIEQQDKTGSYTRKITIKSENGETEVQLFSDEKEGLQFEV